MYWCGKNTLGVLQAMYHAILSTNRDCSCHLKISWPQETETFAAELCRLSPRLQGAVLTHHPSKHTLDHSFRLQADIPDQRGSQNNAENNGYSGDIDVVERPEVCLNYVCPHVALEFPDSANGLDDTQRYRRRYTVLGKILPE